MHKYAIKESTSKADMIQKLVQLLSESKLQSNKPISTSFEQIAKDIATEIHKTKQQPKAKTQGIQRGGG
jgi:hypothetical protein